MQTLHWVNLLLQIERLLFDGGENLNREAEEVRRKGGYIPNFTFIYRLISDLFLRIYES
jgi:hypothetical protein